MEHLTYGEFITSKIADIPYGQAFQTDVIAEAMTEEYKSLSIKLNRLPTLP